MNSNKTLLVIGLTALTAFACGGIESGRAIDAQLDAPEARDSKIALRPALDISNLYDPAIADRIVIEEIDLNVSDVRLLGADPRLPAGGLPLLAKNRILEAFDGETPSLELPFPAYLAEQDDLAVYIRVDRSETLMNASVVVRGRIYASAVHGGWSSLTAQGNDDVAEQEDEDTNTAQKGDVKGIDPDGDPADPADPCGIDPDGDPADPTCSRHRNIVSRGESSRSVPFELRGDDVADLITAVGTEAAADVVIGIPASRWFTPESMSAIEAQLRQPQQQQPGKIGENRLEADPLVIEARMNDKTEQAMEQLANTEYFAAEDRPGIDALKIRRPDRTR